MASAKGTNSKKTIEVVAALASPIAEEQKLDIWDVVYEKVGGNAFLRFIIDKPDGVTIEDCEKFSRAIDPIIDKADPISENYLLEVSSPGMGRELRTEKHFESLLGQPIKVSLYKVFMDKKEHIGILKDFDKNMFIIETEDGEVSFDKKECSKIRLYDDELYM